MPIVDLVNNMIQDAVSKRASDIHFDPTPDYLNVRIRIDGELIKYAEVPSLVKKNLATRIKIIAGMNITEQRLPQDGAIKMTYNDRPVDMRVSSLPIVDGEKIVIRILDYSRSLEGLEVLGFTDDNLDKVNRIISAPNGIILVTGATGSGKSTTVYSMLQKLNKTSTNIITVEDPVEMKIPGLNQVQVMSDIGLTFASALRSILRQDPDVIMIGEIRDDETARIAVRASITGHLVLSTIHTNNSLNTIERLLDMDVERYLLGTALMGIVSQRLAKRLCPKCRKARPVTKYEGIVFKKALGLDVKEIYEPVGCKDCIDGYMGRIAVHEVLEINQEIRDAIVNNIRKDKLRDLVYNKAHVQSILQDGLMKVVNGLTSFEEILRIIDVDEDFGDNDAELKAALLGKYEENKKEQEKPEYEVLDL
jgi:type IV pilus assembly protein PilB